jgi:hypothetical protein
MVKRGGCSFTRKAEMVGKAGYDGLVVFNGDSADEKLMRMPAQRNFKTKELVPIDFEGQAVMIDSKNGDLLLAAMLTAGETESSGSVDEFGLKVVLRADECSAHADTMTQSFSSWTDALDTPKENIFDFHGRFAEEIERNKKITIELLSKQKITPNVYLFMWNGNIHSRRLPVMIAKFGEIDRSVLQKEPPSRIIFGIPDDGCDDRGFSNRVKGAWVIVKRGGCSFVDKARTVQKVGGTAIVVLNTRKKPYLFEMPMGPEGL